MKTQNTQLQAIIDKYCKKGEQDTEPKTTAQELVEWS